MNKNKNRPKRQQKKPKQEFKKTQRGRKFNPWVYKYFDVYFDVTADLQGGTQMSEQNNMTADERYCFDCIHNEVCRWCPHDGCDFKEILKETARTEVKQ